jgi:hypothetical protein
LRETDCVAGVRGLELRNVGANYPFERSHRFAGICPNSGHSDYSRLSCGGRNTQLGSGCSGLGRCSAVTAIRLRRVTHSCKPDMAYRDWTVWLGT